MERVPLFPVDSVGIHSVRNDVEIQVATRTRYPQRTCGQESGRIGRSRHRRIGPSIRAGQRAEEGYAKAVTSIPTLHMLLWITLGTAPRVGVDNCGDRWGTVL
ncbi:hypothetical protein GCM10009793_21230 [Brachybacterium phenoliresistens]